jgi:2-polyprenyl-3-methyl-5-hydroxy-6-metoxy-1,4-benzoquinol methylase
MKADVRAQLDVLYTNAPRESYFEAARTAIAEYYLADPTNPYQQSGRSSGPERWRETRHCIVQAVHRDGDFLDVGCANGLLLESLIGWSAERGFRIRPHGIDFVPGLIDLARRRFPESASSFEVANAFYWVPPRQFDYVRTNLEYVQPGDWPQFIARQHAAVAPGGRLILCHYRNETDQHLDLGALLIDLGYPIVGRVDAPALSLAWCERAPQDRMVPSGKMPKD